MYLLASKTVIVPNQTDFRESQIGPGLKRGIYLISFKPQIHGPVLFFFNFGFVFFGP